MRDKVLAEFLTLAPRPTQVNGLVSEMSATTSNEILDLEPVQLVRTSRKNQGIGSRSISAIVEQRREGASQSTCALQPVARRQQAPDRCPVRERTQSTRRRGASNGRRPALNPQAV